MKASHARSGGPARKMAEIETLMQEDGPIVQTYWRNLLTYYDKRWSVSRCIPRISCSATSSPWAASPQTQHDPFHALPGTDRTAVDQRRTASMLAGGTLLSDSRRTSPPAAMAAVPRNNRDRADVQLFGPLRNVLKGALPDDGRGREASNSAWPPGAVIGHAGGVRRYTSRFGQPAPHIDERSGSFIFRICILNIRRNNSCRFPGARRRS